MVEADGRAKSRRLVMKYIVAWTFRRNGTAGEVEADEDRALKVFSKWSPPPETTMHAFLSRVDGRGGYAVVETDSVEALANAPAIFGPWLDYDVIPVVDIQDAVVMLEKG